jgi:hypothetical protein
MAAAQLLCLNRFKPLLNPDTEESGDCARLHGMLSDSQIDQLVVRSQRLKLLVTLPFAWLSGCS